MVPVNFWKHLGWTSLALWGMHGRRASRPTFLSLSFHTWKLGREVPAVAVTWGLKHTVFAKGLAWHLAAGRCPSGGQGLWRCFLQFLLNLCRK